MKNHKFLTVSIFIIVLSVCVFWGLKQVFAADNSQDPNSQSIVQGEGQKSPYQRRQEALQRLHNITGEDLPQMAVPKQPVSNKEQPKSLSKTQNQEAPKSITLPAGPLVGFNPAVDYNLPNFAYSPNIRKFVDSLPGLTAAHQNNLGQYIPVANPDKTTYLDADYYVLGIKQYRRQMNSDLPAVGTLLRGYYQKNSGTTGATDNNSQYLGALILARSYDPTKPIDVNGNGRPVRVLYYNELGLSNTPDGNFPLPVDTTTMGAGMGPIMGQNYTQNRAVIHLHGGATPWISDGTPHQWITPANDPTMYKKGVSFQNVPDMIGPGKSIPVPDTNDGKGTLYYTNQQSGRLMFYHDHAYGTTRLGVYAGMAAPYLLVDQVEDDMIAGTNISGAFTSGKKVLPDQNDPNGAYKYGIPLVIQDKTFVNDNNTPPHAGFSGTQTAKTSVVDPLWYKYVKTGGGNLWFPHEYIPNEDPYDPNGFNPYGRWDYGPWLNPAMIPLNYTLPSPTMIPETYGDTPVINGCAFPYVTLEPRAYRFRILNACNDRVVNLQFYYADPHDTNEVKMVPAIPDDAHPTWPRDGRDGGVPDPNTAGPDIIQIGNEGGLLPQVAVIPAQPIDFDYNRRSITFGGVTSQSLLLMPAERADIVVDFNSCPPGSTLIMYNDAPAPMPLFDTRNDCYTNDNDQRDVGGAPPTSAGFGPNIRTMMQIRIAGTPAAAFDINSLKAALPKAYKKTQAAPIVPQSAYNAAFGTAYGNTYVQNITDSINLTGTTQPVAMVVTTLPGSGYTTAPTVTFIGGGGSGAAATATLNGVTAVTVTAAGTGYTSAPTVTFSGGGGTGATAIASISGGGVSAITVVNPGSNYTANPTVKIAGGGGTGAAATSGITLGAVGAINLTSGGSGYSSAPQIFLTGGGGTGATASCLLRGDLPIGMKNITEGMDVTYGRMNVMLGTTPVPLDPNAPAPQVPGIAMYIDPPSDFWTDGQTYVFRIAHLGVDSHIIHFHLANLQVINRVDYTNTILPPHENELGWKESIRTNPFTDLILAVKPVAPVLLPFQVPQSNRLMDPTTPAGSTLNYVQAAPVPGLPTPANISNVMTNYGWEYVWHCHLLGHEENDMMRPIVFSLALPNGAPSNLTLTETAGTAPIQITLHWADHSTNELGFIVQRATNSAFTAGLQTFTITGPNTTSYVDTDNTLLGKTRYYYQVAAWTQQGNSAFSNTANIVTPVGPLPAAPSGLAYGSVTRTSVVLTWTDNATNETGFVIQRAADAGFTSKKSSKTINTPNLTTATMTGLKRNTTYYYEVFSTNAAGNSASPSNVVHFTTLP